MNGFSMTEPDGEPPPYSFAQLITQAIASTSDRQMTLEGIYGFIRCNYPWYRTCDKGWMNSIRYNLAFRPEFINAPCKPGEIGFGWRMDPSCEDRFIKCAFKKPERIAGTSSEYLDITSSQEKVSNVDQTNAIHSLESMVSNIGIQPNVTCSNSGNLSGTEIKTEPIEGGAASAIEVVEESGAIEIKIEPIEGGAASAIEVVEESGAIDTRTSNYCENCHTLTTGHWRNVDGKKLCNACGQYFVLHGKDRPAHFFTECIRKRRRNGSTVHNRNPINHSIDVSQYTVRYRAIAPAPPPLVHPTRNPINQSIDVSQYTQTYPQHLCYRRIAPAPPPLHPTRIPINQSIYANQYTQTLYPQHLPYVPIPPTPPPLYPTRNLILENRFRDLKLENEEMKQQLFLKDRQFSEVNNKQQKLIEEHRSKFKDYEQLVKADLESLKLILNDPQSFKSIVVLPKESLMRVFNEFQMIKTDFTALKTDFMKMSSELKDLRIKLDQIALSGKTLTSTHHAVVECNEELSKSTLSRTAEIHNLTFEMLRKDFLKEQSVREKVCHLNRQLKVTLKDIQQGSRKRKSRQTDGESDKKKAKKKQLEV